MPMPYDDEPRFISSGRKPDEPPRRGGTRFESMRREDAASVAPGKPAHGIGTECDEVPGGRHLLVVEQPGGGGGDVRFDRGEVDGKPGVVMEQRQDSGAWERIWSVPSQSEDAREGMMGWLNTQGHRWDRFAKMLARRGGDELTAWIFELMVKPSARAARPPRVAPRIWGTVERYRRPGWAQAAREEVGRRPGGCPCRPQPRDF